MTRPANRSRFRLLVNRWHTLRALVWLITLRIGLALLPFPTLLRLQRRASRVRDRDLPLPTVPRMTSAVERASRYLPGKDTCLSEAMAGQVLLARAGFESELQIGVATPKTDRRFAAHAWLECRGYIVLGEEEAGDYTALSTPQGASEPPQFKKT